MSLLTGPIDFKFGARYMMPKNTFFCIDGHTCGNPVRLVVGGAPQLNGSTMSEKRQHFIQHYDWIRKALMFEPRGHDMMSGGMLYPALGDKADAAILFIETSGCLPMCGHGTIGIVTFALQQGYITPKTPGKLTLDVPAGQIEVEYLQNDDVVESVKIYNVDSFLFAEDVVIDCPGIGKLRVDVAYGGNFYVIVDPQENFISLDQMSVKDILQYSPIVRELTASKLNCVHPLDQTICGPSHVQWTGTPKTAGAHGRNAVFYGDNAIDRSPCGTGTSARMAQLVAKGQLKVGDTFVHESIIGTQFVGIVENSSQVGDFRAIKPSVAGWARITGFNTLFVDPHDPLHEGFQLK